LVPSRRQSVAERLDVAGSHAERGMVRETIPDRVQTSSGQRRGRLGTRERRACKTGRGRVRQGNRGRADRDAERHFGRRLFGPV